MHESDATVTVALRRFCLHFAADAGDSSWQSRSVAFLLRFGTIVCGTDKEHTDFVPPMQRVFQEIFSVQMGMSYSSTEAMCATNNVLVECIRQDIRPLTTRCLIVIHEEGKALQLQLVKSESMRTWFQNQWAIKPNGATGRVLPAGDDISPGHLEIHYVYQRHVLGCSTASTSEVCQQYAARIWD